MSTQSLKSANQVRVNVATATDGIAFTRLNGLQVNEHSLCGAGWTTTQHDVYFRPVNNNTLKAATPECGNLNIQNAGRRIEVENMERPYVPVCAPGFRGGGDTLGKGRDQMPIGIYSNGDSRGAFVKLNTNRNAGFSCPTECCGRDSTAPFPNRRLTQDASHRVYRG